MTRARWLLAILALALFALIVLKPKHRPPVNAPVADNGVEPAGLQPHPIHELRNEDFNGGDHYLVRNLVAGPIEVQCRLEDAQNVASDPPLPRSLVVPASAELELTELRPVDQSKGSGASIECGAMVGDPGASAPDNVTYALPFYPGTEFTLDQGFNGAFSHHDAESRYSLDLDVPEGTSVLAARDGVVMQIEEDFHGSGANAERYGDRANYVRVLHADGSMALYAHLAPGSTLYRLGDHVRTGDFLGKSGNTGFSTGPHLHFSVQKNAGMALQSIPFAMTGVDPYHPRDN
jgi:murein DD-endopeptidase MepM/ murein hydrolase activator NlpD